MGPEEFNYEFGPQGCRWYRALRDNPEEHSICCALLRFPINGKNKPVAENNSQQGRAKNRRVEILVYRHGIARC